MATGKRNPAPVHLADPHAVGAALGMTPPPHWRATWAQSAVGFQPNRVPFLDPAFVGRACRALGIAPELRSAFLAPLPRFAENPCLQRLAWHCHRLIFSVYPDPEFYPWPMLPPEWGEAADMFYPLVLLSATPAAQAFYRQRGIDRLVFRDTFADFSLHIGKYRAINGRWGLGNVAWMMRHFTGKIFRLGRLQFMFDTYRQDFRAFRHRRDGRVILLAEPNLRFRSDGQYDGVNGVHDPEAFATSLDVRTMPIRGNAVTPLGRVLRQTVFLPVSDWLQALTPGDPSLSVHIPAIGRMSHEACGQSLSAAIPFFQTHFPDRPYRVFTCDSWILDPAFETYAGLEANIVRFQREMYLHPVMGRQEGVLGSVFGTPVVNPRTGPQDTGLRRAVLAGLAAGQLWCGGGSLLFPQDLQWGRRVYRSQKLPELTIEATRD